MNCRDLWKYIQSKKVHLCRIPGKTTYEGKNFANPKQIFDIFADHFANIFVDKTNIVTSTDVRYDKISFNTLRKICLSH